MMLSPLVTGLRFRRGLVPTFLQSLNRLRLHTFKAQIFPKPILYLAGLASSWEHALNNPSILIDGEDMAFCNFMKKPGQTPSFSVRPADQPIDVGSPSVDHLKAAVDNDVLEISSVLKNKDVSGFKLAVVGEGCSGQSVDVAKSYKKRCLITKALEEEATVMRLVAGVGKHPRVLARYIRNLASSSDSLTLDVKEDYAGHNMLYNLHYPFLKDKLGFLTFDELVNVYDVHAFQMAIVRNMFMVASAEDFKKKLSEELEGLKPRVKEKVVDLSLKLKAADLEKARLVKDLLTLAIKKLFEPEHFNHILGDLQQKAITFEKVGRSFEDLAAVEPRSIQEKTWGSSSTHPLCVLHSLFSDPLTISLFVTSVKPLACGWYTKVKACLILSLSHNSGNTPSLNCLPLSNIIIHGIPKRHMNLSTCFLVTLARCFASTHLVKILHGCPQSCSLLALGLHISTKGKRSSVEGSVDEDLGSSSTHPLCVLHSLFSDPLTISLFVTFVKPLACGWYTKVKACLILSLSRNSGNTPSLNCLPLSDIIIHASEQSLLDAPSVYSFYPVYSHFLSGPWSVLKNDKDFSMLLDRNPLRHARLPFKLYTSLMILGHLRLPLYASRKHLSLNSESDSTFQSIFGNEKQSFRQALLMYVKSTYILQVPSVFLTIAVLATHVWYLVSLSIPSSFSSLTSLDAAALH
nr:hypothetical protein [Tanacetum cinerariifolium]